MIPSGFLDQISAPFIISFYPRDGGSTACCTVIAQLFTLLNVTSATNSLGTVKGFNVHRGNCLEKHTVYKTSAWIVNSVNRTTILDIKV